MDEKVIIYTLAGVIISVVGYFLQREQKREAERKQDMEARIKEKDTEIQRLTTELKGEVKALQEWKDKFYEEAIKRRLKNGYTG